MNELSLHILDICQNSIQANATLIEIRIDEQTSANEYSITIRDNGHGMDEKTLSEVADPFYTTRTTRKVGMGVSLFKMAAEQAGGSFIITSKPNQGTQIVATFENDHLDRAPLGAIEDTLLILILNEAGIDIRYEHVVDNRSYIFDTRDVKQVLNGIPLTDSDVIMWVKNNITEGISSIHKEESL